MTSHLKKHHLWFMWILAASFFLAEYFARVAPSVMVNELMRDLHVKAFALGSLSAFFYYAYLLMQIPAGAMVDTLSTKKLLSTMAILCGLSCVGFSFSHNIIMADLNRVLMGFSAAFAFVGALKIANTWFPAYRFGLLAGATQALGMIGAALGEGPVASLVSDFGWRLTMLWIGLILLLIGMLMYFIIRDKPKSHSNLAATRRHLSHSLQGIRQVLTHRSTWVNGLFAGCLYAPTAAFAELWGPSYIHTVNGFSHIHAAEAISMIFIGWAVGSPIAGWISDRIQRRKPIMWVSACLSCLGMAGILFLPHLSYSMLMTLLFFYGFCNVAVATAYAVAAEMHPKPLAGTAMGFTNMASVIIGASFQPLIGRLLDLHWQGNILDGTPIYSAHNFQSAMLLLPVCGLLAIILCRFIPESFPTSSS
ncbi:MAG TPA: MFS transporter [Coxiellaceae bacterium]|nr:MFS transporter [Coxiellaceae bacterium]